MYGTFQYSKVKFPWYRVPQRLAGFKSEPNLLLVIEPFIQDWVLSVLPSLGGRSLLNLGGDRIIIAKTDRCGAVLPSRSNIILASNSGTTVRGVLHTPLLNFFGLLQVQSTDHCKNCGAVLPSRSINSQTALLNKVHWSSWRNHQKRQKRMKRG